MTYRFHSKAAADVFMLPGAGDRVLRAMGLEPGYRGLIEPQAMAAALAAVRTAVADDEARAERPLDDGGVSLRQRAWPLVRMLEAAFAEGEVVIWNG